MNAALSSSEAALKSSSNAPACAVDGPIPVVEKKKTEKPFLLPIRGKIKRRKYAVLDLETKRKNTQDAGFERCFLAHFYDGEEHTSFRSDPHLAAKSYEENSWLERGGCIDKMMRLILGFGPCESCGIGPDEYEWGDCKDCVKRRKKYQSRKWYLGSHNGGNFDNLFILGWVRKHLDRLSFDIISTQGRILLLTIKPRGALTNRGKREAWALVDTFALIPISLAEIGQSFCANDEDFQKMSFDLDLHEDDPLWEVYNRRDCAVLLKGLNRFRDLIETIGGATSVTAAGTAMNTFRRRYQKRPIYRNAHFPKCDKKCGRRHCQIEECRRKPHSETECHGCLHDFIREAFFGGRTEVFRRYGTRCVYYDVNSSYPTSMLYEMPVGKARVFPERTSLQTLRTLAKQYIGFVECTIEIPTDTYLPVLPYRWVNPVTKDQKLIFPVGTLYGTWSWIEIEEALKYGAKIREVGKSVWFQKAKVFDQMILALYEYRQKTCKTCGGDQKEGTCHCPVKTWDPGMDYCAKLLMNSCFGKLGTNPEREKMLFPGDEDEELPPWAIMPPAKLAASGYPVRVQHILHSEFIIPQVAAHITADARLRLARGLRSVLDRGGYIIYSDTDSIVASLPVYPEGGQLGEWKKEEDNFDIEVPLPKTYMISRHEKHCRDLTCKGCLLGHEKSCKVHDKKCKNQSCPGCHKDYAKKGKGAKCFGCKAVTVKMKGVPKEVQKPEVFRDLVHDHKSAKFERLTKFRTMFRKGIYSPVEESTERSVKSLYDKRALKEGSTVDTMPLIVRDPVSLKAAREAFAAKRA